MILRQAYIWITMMYAFLFWQCKWLELSHHFLVADLFLKKKIVLLRLPAHELGVHDVHRCCIGRFFFFFSQNQILISLNSALSEMIKILQHNWTTDLSYGILVTKVWSDHMTSMLLFEPYRLICAYSVLSI